MNRNLINSDNWTFCHYASEQLKAVITFGASPDTSEKEFDYYVTVVDEDNTEVFQKEFNKLDIACKYINQRYSDIWDFVDATAATKKAGGCSTCVAH
jgi:hypothetical protein